MNSYAITIVGHDRPGIIADVTGVLAGHGANIEDSTMSLLRGHFAWTLIIGTSGQAAEIDSSLDSLRCPGLTISVLAVTEESTLGQLDTKPYLLTVHGADHTGIVAAMTRVLASHAGNVTDLTTRLAGGLYVIAAEVDLPKVVNVEVLTEELAQVAHELGVIAHLRPADADVL